MKRRIGLQRDAAYVGIQLFQAARRAYECSTSAQHGDEMRDPTFRLLPDFISGAMVMSLPVRVVRVLVGVVIQIRMLGVELARHADRAVRALARIGIEDVCPVSLQ